MSVVTSLREKIASEQHAIWSHWMKYMFTQGIYNKDGSWIMPAEKVERWSRQMNTDYVDLTDKERESDRDQADKVLAIAGAKVIPKLTDEELQTWFSNLPPVPTEEEEGLDRIINDAFHKVFGRPLNPSARPE